MMTKSVGQSLLSNLGGRNLGPGSNENYDTVK